MTDTIFGTIGSTDNIKSLNVYLNRYAVQSVRELPGVFELHGTHPLMRSPDPGAGLGCIWFPYMWNGDRSKLYTDSDPKWIAFIDILLDIVNSADIGQVFFYWP